MGLDALRWKARAFLFRASESICSAHPAVFEFKTEIWNRDGATFKDAKFPQKLEKSLISIDGEPNFKPYISSVISGRAQQKAPPD